MPYPSVGGGGGAGGASIAKDMFFANLAARDAFTTANPGRLFNGVACAVTNGAALDYYMWNGTSWFAANLIFQGIAGTNGAPAPNLKFQYSVDGISAWHDVFAAGVDKFWRWSTDGGTVYVGPAQMVGTDAPDMMIQYSADGATNWLSSPVPGLTHFWRWSTDGGATWSGDYIRYEATSGGGAGLPAPYTAVVNGAQQLEIQKGGEICQTMDEKSVTFRNIVRSGPEGFATPTHSIGSAGENVVFTNLQTDVVYYPSWGGITSSGAVVYNMTDRVHSTTVFTAAVNGPVNTVPVACQFDTDPPSDAVFFDMRIKFAENYTGRIYIKILDSAGVATVMEQEIPSAAYTINQVMTWAFPFPLWLNAGDVVKVSVRKEGATLLNVYNGSVDGAKPWREASFRTFVDYVAYNAGNVTEQATALSGLTGSDRIDASGIKNMPIASATQLGMITVGTGFTIAPDGKLDNNATSAKMVAVANQASMLGLPQITALYIVTRTDLQRNFYLNANLNPAVLANWQQGEYVGDTVVSFNGRNGAVVPEYGDYGAALVPIIESSNPDIEYVTAVQNGQLGIIRIK